MASDLNYHHLRHFWAVATSGSLSGAARALRVAQSSLSVQVQKLEEHLGHPLFERRGRQLVLTEAGRIALDFAESIFRTGDELVGTLSELGRGRPILRVGALAHLSRNFQMEFVRPLLADPEAELVMRAGTAGELADALARFELDVVLANVLPESAEAQLVAHAIAEQPVSLIGRPGLAEGGGALSELLISAPLILPSPASSIRVGFDGLVARLRVSPRVTAEVDDMAMLRLLAREHSGLSVVPPIVVKDELEAGELVEVARLPDLHETFFAITRARRFPNPLLERLLPSDAPPR